MAATTYELKHNEIEAHNYMETLMEDRKLITTMVEDIRNDRRSRNGLVPKVLTLQELCAEKIEESIKMPTTIATMVKSIGTWKLLDSTIHFEKWMALDKLPISNPVKHFVASVFLRNFLNYKRYWATWLDYYTLKGVYVRGHFLFRRTDRRIDVGGEVVAFDPSIHLFFKPFYWPNYPTTQISKFVDCMGETEDDFDDENILWWDEEEKYSEEEIHNPFRYYDDDSEDELYSNEPTSNLSYATSPEKFIPYKVPELIWNGVNE